MTSTESPSSAQNVGTARRGLFAISGAGLLWGTTGIVLQFVRQSSGLSPISVGFYRLAIAAVVLVLLTTRRIRHVMTALRSHPWPVVVTGATVGAFHGLYFAAVAWGGVAVATVVSLGVPPVAVACWEAARARRMPPIATRWGVTAAVLGLALISGLGLSPTGTAPRPISGLVAAGLAGLGYALTTVLSRRIMQELDPLLLTTASTTIGAATLLPVALLGGGLAFPTQLPVAGMLIYLGVVATALAYALFYNGLRTTAGGTALVLTLMEPLAATLLAVVVLGEGISVPSIVGVVFLLGAVLVTHLLPDSEGGEIRERAASPSG